MQQLFSITQQEAVQMQFMLDISRSMSKDYADLVANFNSALTNLFLVRRNAYLGHTHHNQDTFRLCNLRSAPISGGDLFDRSLTQRYEQHLIGLGVKTGTKKERFHHYKKKKGRGGNQCHHAGYVLPTHASTPVYAAIALLPLSPRGLQRRSKWLQWSRLRRQHTQH